MIKESIQQLADLLEKSGHPINTYSAILKHGFEVKEFEELPPSMELGEPKECYYNAFTRMSIKYAYTEGFTTCFGLPIAHAWLTNIETGAAVEVTIPDTEGREYFGVMLQVPFLVELANITGYAGVFCNAFMAPEMFKDGLRNSAIIQPEWGTA